MHASVAILEKPLQHVGLADWYAKQWAIRQANDTRRNDSFILRHEACQLRNETRIKADCDSYQNNVRLTDRVTEVGRWRIILQTCLEKVNHKLSYLIDQKYTIERELDYLTVPIGNVSDCLSMRDGRLGFELTYDDGDTELKTELRVLEGLKQMFVEMCHSADEKIRTLQNVKSKLILDINDKSEAIAIDENVITLDRNSAGISYKMDPLKITPKSISYETWLEHSRYTKLLAEKELSDTDKLREAIFVLQERARNDIDAQRDRVDFTLRKRIYETQSMRSELEWQRGKIVYEMEKLFKGIQKLEDALEYKTNSLKLCSTRLENRTYRPGIELVLDEAEQGLKDEVRQLMQFQIDLQYKINCIKATYNTLENQLVLVENDLNKKSQSLSTDTRCLSLRETFKTKQAHTVSNTDRNIQLTKMENMISPT